jgi:hypothetical protein
VKTHASVATMVCLLSPTCRIAALRRASLLLHHGPGHARQQWRQRGPRGQRHGGGHRRLRAPDNSLLSDVFALQRRRHVQPGHAGRELSGIGNGSQFVRSRSQGYSTNSVQALTAPSSPTARRSSISAIWAAALRLRTELTTWGRWSGRRPQPREKIILSCTALER